MPYNHPRHQKVSLQTVGLASHPEKFVTYLTKENNKGMN